DWSSDVCSSDLIVSNENGDLVIEKRTQKLLNNMWEFPMYEAESNENINTQLSTEIQFQNKPVYSLKHQSTHLTWDIDVYLSQSYVRQQDITLTDNMVWMRVNDKDEYNFPVSMSKIYNFLLTNI